tara:strand:+ start:318 stop:980 length:663 start_codon:yes stop_codon:yes gene_type:complete
MSFLINIETSTTNCSVSLSLKNDLIDIIEKDSVSYSHSENLHYFISELLKKNKINFKDLSAVSVSRGPGSYTGLRIGLSAAKGICYGMEIPLISISSLKILAKSSQFDGYIISTMDARRDEIYSCIYDSKLNIIREEKPEIVNKQTFVDFSEDNKILIIGDGQSKCKNLIEINNNFNFDENILKPSSKDMVELAFEKFRKKNFENLAYFEPKYLKEFRSN